MVESTASFLPCCRSVREAQSRKNFFFEKEKQKLLLPGLKLPVTQRSAPARADARNTVRYQTETLVTFQIRALPAAPFQPLFGQPDASLAAHGVVRVTATNSPGFPCRVSLEDAAVGETLLLLNYEHQPAPTPYRASHAIFVREGAIEAAPSPGDIPELLRCRLLSVRAFDATHMMLEADVTEGTVLEAQIARMFANPAVAYLHLHNAKPGCYAARVDRVQAA